MLFFSNIKEFEKLIFRVVKSTFCDKTSLKLRKKTRSSICTDIHVRIYIPRENLSSNCHVSCFASYTSIDPIVLVYEWYFISLTN